MKKRIGVVFSGAVMIALLLSLVQVAPASAMPPVPFSESGGGSLVNDLVKCTGFDVLDEFQFSGEGRTYLDQDGHKIRSWVKETVDETLTNMSNPALKLHGISTFSGFYYYDEQGNIILARAEGNYMTVHIPVPGHGVVLHNTGLVIADYANNTFEFRGHWDWYTGDLEAVCAYLAGE